VFESEGKPMFGAGCDLQVRGADTPRRTGSAFRAIFVLLSLGALTFGVAHASAGDIAAVSPPGEVTPAGSFMQRVPVEVPSYHGLEPSIGLIYDSSNRDGPVGWGWRLLGDSSIERASRRTGTPRFNYQDDYLLDGERLVPCFEQPMLGASCSSGGTHGLERETFQRVRQEGAEWIVSDRNGVESHYAQPQSGTLFNVRWPLAYRTDRRGNRVDYHRWCDGDDECYLDGIEYHDASLANLRTHIEYRWEKRPHEATYAVGRSTLVHVRYRLRSIVVWSNRHVRSALDITYQSNQLGRWAGASSIRAVTRYGSDVTFDAQGRITGGSHLPPERYATVSSGPPADMTPKPVTFGASASPTSNSWDLWTFPTTLADSAHPDQQRWTAVDLNGDGLDDSVATVYNGPGHGQGVTDLVIHINRGDGTFRDPVTVPTQWLYWFPPPTSGIQLGQTLVAGDFNGDGVKDLLAIWATDTTPAVQAQAAFGSASLPNPASPPNALKLVSFGPVLSLPVAEWTADHRWLVGDQDGDGRDDLIIVEHMDAQQCTAGPRECTFPRIHVLRSDGRSFTELGQGQDVNWTDFPDEAPYWFMGDIDGDGRADIIRVESVFGANGRTAQFGIARSTSPGGFAFSTVPTRAPWEPIVFSGRFGWRPIGADLAKIGDFDGNGLTDVVIFAGWSANSNVSFDHLRSFTFLAQGSGLSNAFVAKEQDLSVNILRQNNYYGAGNLVANTISFPNKWFAMDVNRDGVTDLVLVTAPVVSGDWPQQTRINTLVSNRDGTFQDPKGRTVDITFDCWNRNGPDCDGGPMFDVAPAELNGDQESDLLFAQLVTTSGFVELAGLPASDTYDPALNLHAADVSGDGRLDLVQLRPLGDSVRVQTMVLRGRGSTLPSPVVREYSTQGVPLAGLDVGHWRIGDIGSPTGGTPDGRADLFYQSVDLSGQSSSRGMAKIRGLALLSNGDGTFTASGPAGGSYTNSASSLWRQGDFYGDGAASLTRVLAGPNSLTVEGQPTVNTSADVAAAGFFAVDLDGDGLTDLVTVDAQMSATGVESQTVVALLAVEGGYFHLREWPLPLGVTGIPARSWRPAEINGDGRTDMVSAIPDAAGNESVVGLLFTGDGWEAQTQHFDQTLGAPRTAVQISDFNGDGCADLAWQNSAPALKPRITWLMNQCDGRLAWSTADPGAALDTWTRSWQPVDLDGNGQDELLAFRTTGTDEVTLLRYGTNESAGLLGGADNGIGLSLSVGYGTTAGTFAPTRFGRTQFLVRSVRFATMPNSSGLDSSYTYTGALWSGRRNFLGFGTVSVNAKPVGSPAFNHYLVTTYDQSEGCAMRPLRTEVRGATGLFWADTATYNDTSQSLGNAGIAPWICELERTGHTECELASTCRETSVQVRHYDGFGNVTELVGLGDPSDPTDNRTVSTHMAPPNIARYLVSLPFDVETKDASGNRIAYTQTYYDGATSATTVPSRGNPSRTDEWDPVLGTLTTQRAYDAFGNVRQITDADGRTSSTKWDPVFARFPVRECNVLWCTSQQWDLVLGTKLVETDANHRSIHSVYDALGRHRRTDFPDGGCLTHEYPSWGPQANPFDFAQQRVVETHCGPGSNRDAVVGPWHATYFDGLQRPWRETRSGGYERLRVFAGWKSNPEAETAWKRLGGQNVWTRYHYDDAQRLSNVELPDSQRVITTYDVGATTERSPTGGVHRTTLDGWDRVESVSDDVSVGGARVSATATYTYDALDRMLTAKDANGHVTSWTRSPAGWLRSECRPDTGCRTRQFSRAGLLRTESDALGGRVRYDYDQIGRRRRRRQYSPAGALLETSTWTYDRSPARPGEPNLVGRIASISSTSKTRTSEERSYDVMGRVVRRQMCVSGDCMTVGFGWSSLGNLDTITYPDASGNISPSSEIVRYVYDDANRLQEIDPYVPHITYEPDDQPHTLQFQNGAVQTFLYDPKRRWIDEMKVVGPQGLISQWTYHYFGDGNLRDELRRGLLNSQRGFKYDPSGRLLESRGNTWQTYAYDLAGNIVQENGTTYSYTDPAHPNAVTQAGGAAFTYDANGNATSRNSAPFKWDSLGRMLRADSGPDQIDYIYSADGALARRRHAGSNTDYFGSYVEKLPNGTVAVNYLLGDTIIARREAATGVRFLHRDKLGSTTEVTNANGAAVELYEYDPWGKSRSALGITNDLRFGKGRQDADTRLVRLGVRDLDPEIGRFISPDHLVADPHRPIDLNPYVYARDDPLNTVDPTGQAPPDELQDDIFKKIGEIVDAVEDQLKKIRGTKPSPPTPNAFTGLGTTTPKDPADVALERPTDIKNGDPASSGRQPSSSAPQISQDLEHSSWSTLLKKIWENAGVGVQGGGEMTACLILCFSLQLSAGVYHSPDTGEVTPFYTIGGAMLVGEGPPANQSFDPPRPNTPIFALGLGAQVGGSVGVFASASRTYSDFAGWSENLNVWIPGWNFSYGQSETGQGTVYLGPSVDLGTPYGVSFIPSHTFP
jgi:RHS repeat-associated protein